MHRLVRVCFALLLSMPAARCALVGYQRAAVARQSDAAIRELKCHLKKRRQCAQPVTTDDTTTVKTPIVRVP